jgi:hypothetical protein
VIIVGLPTGFTYPHSAPGHLSAIDLDVCLDFSDENEYDTTTPEEIERILTEETSICIIKEK